MWHIKCGCHVKIKNTVNDDNTEFFFNFAQEYIFINYIEMCNKKDMSPGSFSRQLRLKNVEFGSHFH